MRRSSLAAPLAAALTALIAVTLAGAQSSAPKQETRPSQAGGLDDPTIVAIFDAANTFDVETGQLATTRGRSKEVRDFGAMLVRDHRMVRQQGRDLAKKLSVRPTPPRVFELRTAHQAAMKALRAKKGAEFDQAFLEHEVAFHKAVIDAVNGTLLPAIQNQELKALVVKVAPAFQGHMLAAQNLQPKVAAK
ncbi:MAG TPA: DUF4142 domain-containing protein [Gemmatimonadaceae bacterium]|nr:DUF4142 domain-containing protein [Gemmatimonadaceae bacterium]